MCHSAKLVHFGASSSSAVVSASSSPDQAPTIGSCWTPEGIIQLQCILRHDIFGFSGYAPLLHGAVRVDTTLARQDKRSHHD